MKTSSQHKFLSSLLAGLYILFFISLIFSFRAISSISIVMIFAAGIAWNKITIGHFFHPNIKNLFLLGCIVFFLLQLAALLYTHNTKEGMNHMRLLSGLIITPLAVCSNGYITTVTRNKLMAIYCLLLTAAALYCLGIAIINYNNHNDLFYFFYHQLVLPLHQQHAVYFSIYTFIGLVFLLESMQKNYSLLPRIVTILLIAFLSVFLFLLSSKLVIVFYGLYIAWYSIALARHKRLNKAGIVAAIFVFILGGALLVMTNNPVSSRFHDIVRGDISLVQKDHYSKGDYFNGLQFRLLQWKLVPIILNEQKSWLTGVSPGDAQDYLDQQYINRNMYTGDPATGDKGFLGYHTHNQFLESLLQLGIPGLLVIILIGASLLKMVVQKRQRQFSFIVLLLLAYTFSESVFETQYGIILFTFFPLFAWPEE